MPPAPKFFDEDTHAPVHGEAIADPSGGLTVDTEVRAALINILAALRSAGIIAQD